MLISQAEGHRFRVVPKRRRPRGALLLLFLLVAWSWPAPARALDPDEASFFPRLSLVRVHINRVGREGDAAVAVVDTSAGRYFVPTALPVPTKDPSRWVREREPEKLESLLLTAVGQEAVLLVSEDTPGLIVGCLPDKGPGYVAPLRLVVRK